jgi:tetratricopeptide (TPR) repeat protein
MDSMMRAIDREGADSIMRTGAFVSLLDWEVELADDLNFAGRLPEAETLFRTQLSKNRQIFGASSYPTVDTEAILAGVLDGEGKHVEAEALAKESVASMSHIYARRNTLNSLYDRYPSEGLALILAGQGHYRDAQEINRQLLHAVEGHAVRDQGEVWLTLAQEAAVAGRKSESFACLEKAVKYGFAPTGEIVADTALKSLHGDPRYDAIIATAHQMEAR